ncbi:hypothetical protein D7S78_18830 [Ralstonia pickettii]|jgi:hypothetical protein|uniref:Filamentation induced by cAMP protein Fic n=1 Tax=Ralstonia pickettii (strain 12D) TaxID=428406 RepID=C6BEF3_RALP1|nr:MULTISPECIES: hypothetical protein [Ralstonia]MBA4232260.1 hypothetical protein [Ralstonia sp.]MBA4236689.1 hypothetical protein [Ralstonia sp.]MBA4403305.1 hypothetical protein [Ralstonia sp.]MBA9847566.1 hypothetical protein [Ralstonia pickettii]MBA9852969.1 hypothetical protein [Ralstonia pickettii]
MRLRYRLHLGDAVRQIVACGVTFDRAIEDARIPAADVEWFRQMLNTELQYLATYNYARFRLSGEEVQDWIDRGRPR